MASEIRWEAHQPSIFEGEVEHSNPDLYFHCPNISLSPSPSLSLDVWKCGNHLFSLFIYCGYLKLPGIDYFMNWIWIYLQTVLFLCMMSCKVIQKQSLVVKYLWSRSFLVWGFLRSLVISVCAELGIWRCTWLTRLVLPGVLLFVLSGFLFSQQKVFVLSVQRIVVWITRGEAPENTFGYASMIQIQRVFLIQIIKKNVHQRAGFCLK